jgi:hypothetical protein
MTSPLSSPRTSTTLTPPPSPASDDSPARASAIPGAIHHLTAADLVDNPYRGLADNFIGEFIDTLLRRDLIILNEMGFAPLDGTGAQLLFCFFAAAYERRSVALASHWALGL